MVSSAFRLSSLPLCWRKVSCSRSGCSWYTAIVIVSALTPGAVAPPLFPPFHGITHGGAYENGTATLPVDVSHVGPQSTWVPSALARSKVSGRPRRVFGDAFAAVPPPPLPPPGRNTAISVMTTTIAMNGAYRRRTAEDPAHRLTVPPR